MMTETPAYTIIKKDNSIELREYAEYIKAEVEIVDTTYRKAVYKGFSVLAGYIFGDNVTSKNLAMTSPVQVASSQKIAMTSPVTVSGAGSYTVAFVMPSEFTLKTLPEPKNPTITFNKVDSQVTAAIRFSGYFNERKVRKAKHHLRDWLKEENLEAEGEFLVARYDPPWVPWFLARNEVMIGVKKDFG